MKATKQTKPKGKGTKSNVNPPNSQKNPNLRKDRPAGLTMIMRRYHTEDIPTNKERYLKIVQQQILNRYIQDGMTLNGKGYQLDELALYLRMPTRDIMRRITEGAKEVLGNGNEGLQEAYRALLALAIGSSLKDRQAALTQLEVLRSKQGNKYVPFLSSAVNQMVDTSIKSTKGILDVAKLLQGPGFTAIQVNNQPNQIDKNGVPNQRSIGPNEAIALISQHSDGLSILESESTKQALYDTYIEADGLIPEIVATRQSGPAPELEVNVYTPTKLKKHETRNDTIFPV